MKNKNGFTLVELLAVIAVIGILLFIVLPNFVNIFNNANEGSMVSQENQMVDATKLLIEDFCRHPLSKNKGHCDDVSWQANDNTKYTCYEFLYNNGYMDEIVSQGNRCDGFVIYNSDYSDYKAYISCGNSGYKTQGINELRDKWGSSISGMCGVN